MFDENITNVKIVVLGVGGAGNNAVNKMKNDGIDQEGVELYVINTDMQALQNSPVENKILIGEVTTKGLGAGAIPSVGKEACEENIDRITNAIRGADMVVIAAGMGGGTGTGASPVIAEACKKAGILTVGIVTRPFAFEGKNRNTHASEGLLNLRQFVDSLIVISNDKLMETMGMDDMDHAFANADDVLCHSVKIISSIVYRGSRINLDFADIRTVMKDKGTALIGMGVGNGENKAAEAAENAIHSPLLECAIAGAKNAIINVTYRNMSLNEANLIVEVIKDATRNPDLNVIFGTSRDDSLNDDICVTVIATDFEGGDFNKPTEEINDHVEIETLTLDDLGISEEEKVTEEIKVEDVEVKKERKGFLPLFFKKRGK